MEYKECKINEDIFKDEKLDNDNSGSQIVINNGDVENLDNNG